MTQQPSSSDSVKDFAAQRPVDIATAAGRKVLVLDADTAVRSPAADVVSTPRAGWLAVAGPRIAALLLGVACALWAATPLGGGGIAQIALVVSVVAVTAGALRLALADIPQPQDAFFLPLHMRMWLTFLEALRVLAWEETAVAGMLWLEVQHQVRPWHTFALGAGLTAYLLVTHIAESGAEAGRLLRRQWKLLAIGACLLAVGAGFAMLPAAGAGAGTAALRVLAAVAVVVAAALVLPAA
jgi:hypothetical protein